MTIPRPKSPNRINVWREEVASTTPCSASETEYLAPPIRQPSFWKKILRRDSKSAAGGSKRSKSDGKDITEMYEEPAGEGNAGGLMVPHGEGEDGSSMEIGVDGESEVGGLKERRERLERAARLLKSNGNGVVRVEVESDGDRKEDAEG